MCLRGGRERRLLELRFGAEYRDLPETLYHRDDALLYITHQLM